MRLRAFPMLTLCLGLAAAMPVQTASAQAILPGSVGAEVITRVLLGPGVWLMNWPDTQINYFTSNATLTFERRGPLLMVRIENHRANITCEREVAVSAQGITFDGCAERGIALSWTPDDPVFAFRGQSTLRWYTLRPN
jgi:hypothetical protein